MSDTPLLPGSGESGTATPGATRPTARGFRPTLERRFRNEGLSTDQALAEMQRRRSEGTTRPAGGTVPEVARAASGPAPQPPAVQAPPAPLPFSPLMQMAPPQALEVQPQPPPAADPLAHTALPGPPGDPVFSLQIGGKPEQVALSELVRGYMRYADYTNKTQQTAGELRQAQEAIAGFNRAREMLEAKIPVVIAGLAGEFDKPVDWEKIAREDPIGYAQKDARFKSFQAALIEQQNLAALRAQEHQARKVAMWHQGHEFLSGVIPGWRDDAARKQMQTAQSQHLRDLGYSAEEVAAYEMLDPRQVVLVEESRRFRALVAAHPELLQAPAGRPQPPQSRREMPRALAGNGRFDRLPVHEAGLTDAQRRWEELPERTGRDARETAINLIAARRAAANGGGAPLRPTRGRGF